HGDDRVELGTELRAEGIFRGLRRDIARQIIGDARTAELRGSQKDGEQRPEDSADAMDAEAIERIVIAEPRLEPGDRPQADEARRDADDDGTCRSDPAAGRRYCH